MWEAKPGRQRVAQYNVCASGRTADLPERGCVWRRVWQRLRGGGGSTQCLPWGRALERRARWLAGGKGQREVRKGGTVNESREVAKRK